MTHHIAPAKRKRLSFGFIGGTITELKKVVWLSRREVAYLTVLVLIVAFATGVILGVLDFGFTRLVDVLLVGD